MKKVLLCMLMISAMIMVASCGSKSNGNFTNPAILSEGKVDVTGYFSAESASIPPSRVDDIVQTSVKLKVVKSPAELKLDAVTLMWTAELCDENESVLATTRKAFTSVSDFNSYEEGKEIVLNFQTDSDILDILNAMTIARDTKKVRLKVNVISSTEDFPSAEDLSEYFKSIGLKK